MSCTATDNGDLGAETTGNAFVLGTAMFWGTGATALGCWVVYQRSQCLEKQKVDNLKLPVAVCTDIPLHFIHPDKEPPRAEVCFHVTQNHRQGLFCGSSRAKSWRFLQWDQLVRKGEQLVWQYTWCVLIMCSPWSWGWLWWTISSFGSDWIPLNSKWPYINWVDMIPTGLVRKVM